MNEPDLSTILNQEAGASRRWKFIPLAAILVLAVALSVWWRASSGAASEKVTYVTEPISRGDVRLTVTATGNLEPTNEVTVGSELSGTTLEVYVDTNDQVAKGQPLAKLDTSKLAQQTASSRAITTAAKARVAQAQATQLESAASLARLRKLEEASGGKLPSKAVMDAAVASAARAEADVESAQADVLQAEADVMANESDLGKGMIRSPIDGIVLTRDLEPGQTVAATMTAPELFVVAEKLENMKLEVAVAEADIGSVAREQPATFSVDAWPSRSFEAVVKKVEFGSAVTDNVVTYTTELEISNDDLSLRPGMTATADIAVAEAINALLVPNAALRFNPESAKAKVASAPKKSFISNLIPGPPGRGGGGAKPAATDEEESTIGESTRIWILRNGRPESLAVEVGVSDGRSTEISGDGVTEGLPVIIHSKDVTP